MPLLEIDNLVKHYQVPRKDAWFAHDAVKAVDGVSLSLEEGKTLGIVGESGCGKSTLGRALLRLVEPDSGRVRFQGEDWLALSPKALRQRRGRMQMVFQDPYASLNPRLRVGKAIAEPLALHRGLSGAALEQETADLLEKVGLHSSAGQRYPHEFSGGQRQRIGIARAMASGPRLLVADEPVSSLDISIQAQILNLLKDLQKETGMAVIFIAHDLRVVEYMSDHVAVMNAGKIVEQASARQIYESPQHPYTKTLLAAIPPAPGDQA
jgi:ABC-type oligopeptide transport system ATPase subunit